MVAHDVVAHDGGTENEKGQPQGIAPTNKTNGIAETVGATLVVANDGDTENETGQPQGIAPTMTKSTKLFQPNTILNYYE